MSWVAVGGFGRFERAQVADGPAFVSELLAGLFAQAKVLPPAGVGFAAMPIDHISQELTRAS